MSNSSGSFSSSGGSSGIGSSLTSWANVQFLNEPAYAWAVFLIAITLFLWIWGRTLSFFEKKAL